MQTNIDRQLHPLIGELSVENTPWNAGEHRHRRVVRMDADPDALTLSDRNHLFDEVGVVVPDLLDRELTTVGKRLVELGVAPDTYLVGARLIKLSRRSSTATPPTAAPDTIAHWAYVV